ncbi:MAG: SPFH domain-containing protein [Acidimicrobiales bacterium]
MGLLHESRREFIAAPDTSKGQIVYKWPDDNIRKFARAIVEPDAQAVFMSQGKLMGVLPPGQHTLDASELPFLGMFIDWASAGNAFKAELYFVGTREYPSMRFGGRLDDIQDPMSGLIVTMRAFGEYALRVDDPTKLILNLVGTVDVADNAAVTDWVAQQLLKVTRTSVITQLASGAWPILGLSQHSPDIEAATMPAANLQLADYGVSICRFGNLDVNLSDEDSMKLKKLANDYAYSKLAGGFLQAAQGEALQGMGQGMAEGGGAGNPMIVGMGMGMAGQVAAAPGQAPYGTPEAPNFAGVQADAAGYPAAPSAAPPTTVPTGPPPGAPIADAQPAAPATVACPSCQAQVREGAKFCDSCGSKMQAQCASCQAELRPGAKFCDSCGTAVA